MRLPKRWQLVAAAVCLILVPVGYMASSTAASRTLIDAGATKPAKRVEIFSTLKEGDSVMVRFHSYGCFHNSTYELAFHRASELTVSIVQWPSDTGLPGVALGSTERVELGTLILGESDIAGLDKLMERYRHIQGQNGNCIGNIDEIQFTQHRDDDTVTTEQFKDPSCFPPKDESLTTFRQLIQRASKAADQPN